MIPEVWNAIYNLDIFLRGSPTPYPFGHELAQLTQFLVIFTKTTISPQNFPNLQKKKVNNIYLNSCKDFSAKIVRRNSAKTWK